MHNGINSSSSNGYNTPPKRREARAHAAAKRRERCKRLLALILGVVAGALVQRSVTKSPPDLQLSAARLALSTVQAEKGAVQARLEALEWAESVRKATAAADAKSAVITANQSNKALPKVDLLLVVLSSETKEAALRRQLVRDMYGKYSGRIPVADDKTGNTTNYSFRVLFVQATANSSADGDLNDEYGIFHVNAPRGYRNIVHKMKGMMALVQHFDFKFLMKADDDTFVCLKRVMHRLHHLPQQVQSRVYAGIVTTCGTVPNLPQVGRVIKDRKDRWYDEKYINHTLSALDCYPPYMQGASYILSAPLVRYLYTGRQHLESFVNEDVTMGTWLMGVKRVMVPLAGWHESKLWQCTCSTPKFERDAAYRHSDTNTFYHACKRKVQLDQCSKNLGLC